MPVTIEAASCLRPLPRMLGIHQRPVVVDKMIVPPVRGDPKVRSIGFFLDENTPVMWRHSSWRATAALRARAMRLAPTRAAV